MHNLILLKYFASEKVGDVEIRSNIFQVDDGEFASEFYVMVHAVKEGRDHLLPATGARCVSYAQSTKVADKLTAEIAESSKNLGRVPYTSQRIHVDLGKVDGATPKERQLP